MTNLKRFAPALRKTLAVLLAVITVLSLVGCKKELSTKAGEKVGDTNYDITFYWGPTEDDFTEEEIIRMKEAGFDTVPIQRFPWEYEKIKEVVKLLDKHGLNAHVRDGRLVELLESSEPTTRDAVDAAVKEIVEYYADCDNITEWGIYDEPSASKFERISWAVEAFKKYAPETKTFVNLLPSYAQPSAMGTATYIEYVDRFCSMVTPHYLCVDHYAFFGDGETSEVRGDFYYNLEIVKDMGEKFGIETRFIMLVSQHLTYSDLSKEELLLQANLTLLYGMKGLSWFTYSHENGYSQELVDSNGNTTAHYDYVKEINPQIHVVGNALYNKKIQEVYRLGLDGDNADDVARYKGKKYSGTNVLLGQYDKDHLFVMNGTLMKGDDAVFTMQGIESTQWLNTETGAWEGIASCKYLTTDEGNHSLVLPFSEGVLLREI